MTTKTSKHVGTLMLASLLLGAVTPAVAEPLILACNGHLDSGPYIQEDWRFTLEIADIDSASSPVEQVIQYSDGARTLTGTAAISKSVISLRTAALYRGFPCFEIDDYSNEIVAYLEVSRIDGSMSCRINYTYTSPSGRTSAEYAYFSGRCEKTASATAF